MSLSVHEMTVQVFVPMLVNLGKQLDKAAAYATAKKLEAGVIESLRIAPDMFTLTRQVQLTTDFAKNSTARLAGVEPPKFPDEEKTLAELQRSDACKHIGTASGRVWDDHPHRPVRECLRQRCRTDECADCG